MSVSAGRVWVAVAAQAMRYPTKPIRLVVPLPPAGSTDIVARLVARERLLSLGLVPVGGTPDALGDHLKSEITRWAIVVKEAGTKLE